MEEKRNITEELQAVLEKNSKTQSSTQLTEVYQKFEELGISLKTEYTLPLTDTIGQRHYVKIQNCKH